MSIMLCADYESILHRTPLLNETLIGRIYLQQDDNLLANTSRENKNNNHEYKYM